MNLLSGIDISRRLLQDIKNDIKEKGAKPKFAIFLIGNDEASKIYVKYKAKSALNIGIEPVVYKFESITQKDLIAHIKKLNRDKSINGVMVQLPLLDGIDKKKVLSAIKKHKDVDGLRPDVNASLTKNKDVFAPATPIGVMKLLKEYNLDPSGKEVVIIGKSSIVGRPLGIMLKKQGANVHWLVEGDDLSACKEADILIASAGKKNLVNEDLVKQGAVIIDIGIHRHDGKIVGDVNFDSVFKKAKWITPVPGGVGPMTIYGLLSNVFKAWIQQN